MDRMKQQQAAEPPKRAYGRPFPKGVSPNPLGRGLKGKRFKQLCEDIAAPYGGMSALNPYQKILLTKGARMMLRGERELEHDAGLAARLLNTAARFLGGLDRGSMQDPRHPKQTFKGNKKTGLA